VASSSTVRAKSILCTLTTSAEIFHRRVEGGDRVGGAEVSLDLFAALDEVEQLAIRARPCQASPRLASPRLAAPSRVEPNKKTLPGPALPGHASPRPPAPCRAKLDCLVVLMSFLVSATRQRARAPAAYLRGQTDAATGGVAARIGAYVTPSVLPPLGMPP